MRIFLPFLLPSISRSDLLIPIITKLAERLLVQAYVGGMGMWKGYNRPLTVGRYMEEEEERGGRKGLEEERLR